MTVDRFTETEAWKAVIEALQPAMDGMFLQGLRDPHGADGHGRDNVRLIVPARRPGMVSKLDAALGMLTGDDQRFRRAAIRDGLASCLVCISWREVLIRPFIPPTSENQPFEAASQRLCLSATLGAGGELERAFGRRKIEHLPLPTDARHPCSGRRFFIFNDLAAGDPIRLARDIVSVAGKGLVLAPSHEEARVLADQCNPASWPVLNSDDVATGVEPFAEKANALLDS